MGKTRVLVLEPDQRAALEQGFRSDPGHAFRQRCQTILLKSEKRSSASVGGIVKMTEVSVNSWCNRYEQMGLEGLRTRPGRGRKPILDKEKDGPAVIAAVVAHRQSVRAAKVAYEQATGTEDKLLSEQTLRRFLKALTADIEE